MGSEKNVFGKALDYERGQANTSTDSIGWSNEELLKRVPLIRGYVFKGVFGDSPELCQKLLAVTLGKEIAEVSLVQTEHEIDPLPERRAGRVDLLVVDAAGNRYDVEVQARTHDDEWLRARHYQALMDVEQLKKGSKASDLKESIVIFICDFDPFGKDLWRYDCHTVCVQTGDVVPDRRSSVYLNTRGLKGEVDDGLKALLQLFAGTAIDRDSFVEDILEKLRACVADKRWMEGFMTLEEEKEAYGDMREAKGRDEGLRQGRDEGLRQGRDILAAELNELLESGGPDAVARYLRQNKKDA